MNGITFNGKHSFSDFNLIMNGKKISTPSKKKIKESVPFMNSVYDFSTVGSNGEITYNQRAIEVQFTLISTNKAMLHSKLTKVLEWLQGASQNKLIFDEIKDYYFLAEVEDNIEPIETSEVAEFTVNFICEPFKTGTSIEGTNQYWDTFNFETDYLQNTDFDVVESRNITIYNAGRNTSPMISTSTTGMSVTINGNTFDLFEGDNTDYMFKFKNGANTIIATGTGQIGFYFWKQVL